MPISAHEQFKFVIELKAMSDWDLLAVAAFSDSIDKRRLVKIERGNRDPVYKKFLEAQ